MVGGKLQNNVIPV